MNEQEAEIASSLQKLLSVSGNKNDSGDESGEDATPAVFGKKKSINVDTKRKLHYCLRSTEGNSMRNKSRVVL